MLFCSSLFLFTFLPFQLQQLHQNSYQRVRLLIIIYTLQQLGMESDPIENGSSDIMELEELSLFEQDPFVQQISLIDDKPELIDESMHLLEGQNILQKHPSYLIVESDSLYIRGQFQTFVSNYRLILFSPRFKTSETNIQMNKRQTPISIPFSLMSEIDLVKRQIAIKLKTGLNLKVKPPLSDFQNLYQLFLKGYMAIPFFSLRVFENEESLTYDCLAEMQRIRMNWASLIIVNNSSGQHCPSYPKYFIVPKKVESNLLEECLRIRNERRVPVATYYWTDCRVALWRGAKVKANLENNKFNQAYLKEISRDLVTIQIHQQISYREPKSMKCINYAFKYMTNSGLNSLFQKIVVSYSKNEQILKLLERWNEDISQILKCAYLAVSELKGGKEVLLQQNIGADRSCQIAALAQLIIDPFYRTINGFSILVEKEFVSFGHPFNYRMGFEREKTHEESPIFIQFLECVSQLITAHPHCFEFSSFYLARIAYEAFTAKYNNFFFNDEELKKRYENILKTQNIWKHLPMMKQYYNYQWCEKQAVKPLIVMRGMPSVKQFLVWREFYDMVSELRCEQPNQIHVKKRRSSIYKMFRSNSLKSE